MLDGNFAQRLTDLASDAVIALCFNSVSRTGQAGSLAQEFIVPGRALLGLNTVLIAYFHEQFA